MIFPCIYLLYPKLVQPFHFSLFYLNPLLMVISTGLNILYSFCTESTSTIFTFLTSFFYPTPPISTLLLVWPAFHSYPSLFRCLFVLQWDFCLGIIPVHVLCLSQSNPSSTALPCPFLLSCVI
jgi:hypothetical protein